MVNSSFVILAALLMVYVVYVECQTEQCICASKVIPDFCGWRVNTGHLSGNCSEKVLYRCQQQYAPAQPMNTCGGWVGCVDTTGVPGSTSGVVGSDRCSLRNGKAFNRKFNNQ